MLPSPLVKVMLNSAAVECRNSPHENTADRARPLPRVEKGLSRQAGQFAFLVSHLKFEERRISREDCCRKAPIQIHFHRLIFRSPEGRYRFVFVFPELKLCL